MWTIFKTTSEDCLSFRKDQLNSPLPPFDILYMYSVITVIWSVKYKQQLNRAIATSPGFPVELMQKHPSNVNTWKEIGNDHSNNASESHKLIT